MLGAVLQEGRARGAGRRLTRVRLVRGYLQSDSGTHPFDAVLGPDEALGPDTVFYVLEGRSVRPYRP